MSDTELNPTAAQAADVTPPTAQEPDDDFNKDRAMATIQKLRSFEKDAKAKLARLAELEAQAAERDQADMSAAQKAEKRAAELAAKYEAAQNALRRATLKDALRAASDTAKLTFNPGALDDALTLGLITDLEIDDDGTVRGVGKALKQLQESRPHFFATPRVPATDAASSGKTSKADAESEVRARNRNAWGIRSISSE